MTPGPKKPVNLNKVRKARAKEEAKRKADANAALHGLSGAEKKRARAEADRAARAHARTRRETGPGDA
jgi:hypothetical protein